MGSTVFSIGHSTRSLDHFLELLTQHDIRMIADVRRFPGSRRSPQFGTAQLPAALRTAGIQYAHIPELGGRRRPCPDSPNTAWRINAFRGYADYLATPEFAGGLAILLALVAQKPVALLSAEALWWRCHRRLIADVLIVHGQRVEHILGPGVTTVHELPPFAHLEGMHITYPAAQPPLQGQLL